MRTNPRSRQRMAVMLHMVMSLVIMILVAQLWLFTVTLEAIESGEASTNSIMAASICSLAASGAVWVLIGLFLRAEQRH